MRSHVGIIGVGHVGASVAQMIVMRGSAAQLTLIDKNDKKAHAEMLDTTDQNAFLTSSTRVDYLPYEGDWGELADCDVLVTAVGNITLLQGKDPDRLAELKNSAKIMKEIAPRIKQSGFHGIIINITNPCDVVVTYLQRLLDYPKDKIFGTGTTLDTARMRHAIADLFDCSQQDVAGYVMGEHGETQFTAWSTVYVSGLPVLEEAQKRGLKLPEIKARIQAGAWRIISGKGFTSYGIGLTATRLVEAVLTDARQSFPLSSYNEQYQTYIGQVTKIGQAGVLEHEDVHLNAEEQEEFSKSATAVHNNYKIINQ